MLAAAADAQASVEELAAIVRAARAEVVEAFEVAREPQLWTTLERRSIEAVKDIVDGRNPLEELSAHGIFSTADVLRAGTDRLTSVPGVGEGAARKGDPRRRAAAPGHAGLAGVPHRLRSEERRNDPAAAGVGRVGLGPARR